MNARPRRAKIVCTVGPASRSEAVLRKMIQAGMDVARLNFSHGSYEDHERTVNLLRKLREEIEKPLGILQDLQGPKLRVGALAEPVTLRRGDRIRLSTLRNPAAGTIPVSFPGLPNEVERGDTILLDDGLLRLRVRKTSKTEVSCDVEEGGLLRSQKGLNLPGKKVRLPSLTAKDKKDLAFGLSMGVDLVALSFVRERRDILALTRFLAKCGRLVPVIAKIEKPQALEDLDGILEAAQGVMVARGDLGVELPPERVPVLQKTIIRSARTAGKTVITATQMLESMVEHSRPTRAEASDVANAIFDGSDAVMLSAETAAGKHPVEAVAMMARIITEAEGSAEYRFGPLPHMIQGAKASVAEAIGEAAGKAAIDVGARAIAVFTQSGRTAQVVAKYRPGVPVIAFSPSEEVCRRLALVWGVEPKRIEALPTTDVMTERVALALRKDRRVQKGDLIVVTAGTPLHDAGTTNFLKVHRVG